MSCCTVLMYHVIDTPMNNTEAPFCCEPALFRQHMEYLKISGYTVLSLNELLTGISRRQVFPKNSVAITFDDGVACSYEKALPILDEFGFNATFFLISGLLGKTNEWAQNIGFPIRKMLTKEQLRALKSAGMEIGSHTINHRRLDQLDLDSIRIEVRDSKFQLEDIMGCEVLHFAYPMGRVNADVRREVAEAGYGSASGTIAGRNYINQNLFMLNRLDIRGNDSLWRFKFKLSFAVGSVPPYSDIKRIGRKLLVDVGLLSPRPWQIADNE